MVKVSSRHHIKIPIYVTVLAFPCKSWFPYVKSLPMFTGHMTEDFGFFIVCNCSKEQSFISVVYVILKLHKNLSKR